ncbi:hypothetical protein C8R44DRAFT_651312 [Mycena epipterygia]|nr:hypothetical protein C8R44DRAFT_651312 [Mycena epipterygia]
MHRYPQPEKDSGQQYGEDVHAFVARRKAQNEQLAKRETPKMQQERLQREANATRGAPPGRKGARVFVWDEEETGCFIRRAINRDKAGDMWDEFTRNQRLYDGFRNEWDLCTALAPDEEPQGFDDEDDEMYVPDAEFPELPGIPDALLPAENARNPATMYDPYEDMTKIPLARFGFTQPTSPRASYKNPLKIDLSLKSLGDDKWPGLETPEYRHLPTLLAYLEGAQSIHDIPSELLDLRQQGAEISLMSNWTVVVRRERLDGKIYYVLAPKTSLPVEFPLYILLPSAVTTVQVLRMRCFNPREIIFHLLKHGVEFRLCFRDDVGIAPEPLLDRFTGLGYRHVGYKPSLIDHGVYEMLRERFLGSTRGRAALFAGGIVGRLARLIVDEDLACLGPSHEVFMTGIRLWDGQSSEAYWDDELTDQDIDLICGVYEIATGASTAILMRLFLTIFRADQQER